MSAKAGRCGARCGTGHAVNQTPARKRQTETRTRPPPTFSLPNRKHRLSLRGLANPEKPVLWPFRASFWVPLTWLTAFRSAYLGPQLASLSITHWLTGGHDKQILDSLMHCGPMATVYAFWRRAVLGRQGICRPSGVCRTTGYGRPIRTAADLLRKAPARAIAARIARARLAPARSESAALRRARWYHTDVASDP